jgi:hypothetical protein
LHAAPSGVNPEDPVSAQQIVAEYARAPAEHSLRLKTRRELEQEIEQRVAEERKRLEQQARTRQPPKHFHRPIERPFTAAERNTVTILFGGLTWKHEWLIRSGFESAGYKVALLPTPDVAGFQLGKEFGNNGQCNPTYFMVGVKGNFSVTLYS